MQGQSQTIRFAQGHLSHGSSCRWLRLAYANSLAGEASCSDFGVPFSYHCEASMSAAAKQRQGEAICRVSRREPSERPTISGQESTRLLLLLRSCARLGYDSSDCAVQAAQPNQAECVLALVRRLTCAAAWKVSARQPCCWALTHQPQPIAEPSLTRVRLQCIGPGATFSGLNSCSSPSHSGH